ncbi:unnamed protein product [Ectocarpus sp. CCAP 1310/34]|nr:unnamed protein product [Ectocarpus sp. CCAP 1310/34]
MGGNDTSTTSKKTPQEPLAPSASRAAATDDASHELRNSSPSGCSRKKLLMSASSVAGSDLDPNPMSSRPKTAPADETRGTSSSLSPGASPTSSLSPPPTSTSSPKTLPVPKAPRCEYPGCPKSAKYGLREAPPSKCQAHKRAGQYTTNRHGELLMATRDGDAFRTPAVAVPVPAVTVPPSPASSEIAGTEAASARPRRRSTGSSGSSVPSHRKPKENLSSSVHTLKRKNRPGTSSSRHEESPAPKNRSCLFPGCGARPTHGLPGAARAVYCFSHKKGSMVDLFSEALAVNNHEEKSVTSAAPTEGKKKKQTQAKKEREMTGMTADQRGAKQARRESSIMEGNKGTTSKDDGGHRGAKKIRDNETKVNRGMGASGGSVGAIATAAAAGTSEMSVKSPAAKPLVKSTSEAKEPADTTAPPPQPTSRPSDGMAPSVEMLILRQAREAAKTEAEASGSGRRPRAPSRRALEASGRLRGDGAQWMTREKKAEQARVNSELRKKRKESREAGLKVGVVLEAFVPRAPSRRALEASGRLRGDGAQWMTREKKAEQARVNSELRKKRKESREAGLKVGVVLEAFVPRAPSRRALEASGRLRGDGAQWMTREKKAEQARVNTELREKRKKSREAGLKVGVVLEAFV